MISVWLSCWMEVIQVIESMSDVPGAAWQGRSPRADNQTASPSWGGGETRNIPPMNRSVRFWRRLAKACPKDANKFAKFSSRTGFTASSNVCSSFHREGIGAGRLADPLVASGEVPIRAMPACACGPLKPGLFQHCLESNQACNWQSLSCASSEQIPMQQRME